MINSQLFKSNVLCTYNFQFYQNRGKTILEKSIALLRFELRLKDLKSSVLTTTPYELYLQTHALELLISLTALLYWWRSHLDSQ